MTCFKRHTWTVFSLLIIVPVGFYSKFYTGPAATWVNNSLSGMFYEIFWCILVFLFLDKVNPWKIVTYVLIITCFLEFLQLWRHPILELLRRYFIGRTILGNYFTWSDFPYYFLGCGIGWFWISGLKKMEILYKPKGIS